MIVEFIMLTLLVICNNNVLDCNITPFTSDMVIFYSLDRHLRRRPALSEHSNTFSNISTINQFLSDIYALKLSLLPQLSTNKSSYM